MRDNLHDGLGWGEEGWLWLCDYGKKQRCDQDEGF